MKDFMKIINESKEIEESVSDWLKHAAAAAAAGAMTFGYASHAGDHHDTAGYEDVVHTDHVAPRGDIAQDADGVDASEPASATQESREYLSDENEKAEEITEAYRAFVASADYLSEAALEDDEGEDDEGDAEDVTESFNRAGVATAFASLALIGLAQIHNANLDREDRMKELAQNAETSDSARLAAQANPMPKVVYVKDRGQELPTRYAHLKDVRYIDELPQDIREDWDALTMTIWGEGRGQSAEAMTNIANSIRNRVAEGRWGDSYASVVRAPRQFSCWNRDDPNYKSMHEMRNLDHRLTSLFGTTKYQALMGEVQNNPDFRAWVEAKSIAWKIISNRVGDTTGGADHYHTRAVNPKWDASMNVTSSDDAHVFSRGL